jgi:tetratricopeptide (TPR) repeat protein
MKQPFSCAFLILALSFSPFSASAQKPGGGGGGKTVPAIPASKPPANVPAMGSDIPLGHLFLSGKVVIDDGTVLTEGATIQTVCDGQKHNETYTDSKGWFSFEFVTRASALTGNSAWVGADAESQLTNPTSMGGTQRDWKRCQLQAQLPGFTSDVVELSKSHSGEQNDLGRIVLHRMEQVRGTTISATSAAAPGAARKAFEKGRDHEKNSKWEEARQDFEKAVQIYPNYAVAWYELGRMQAQKKDAAGAAHSFNQALATDHRFASPYLGLTELAYHARQWPQVVSFTERLLALNPVNFPNAWFFNSVGNYFLQNLDVAEKSARQGIRTDEQHTIPKLEYVLGMILMEKRNYQEATLHMQQYLHLVHTPADVDEAQKQLAEITRLSTTASIPAVVEEK